MIKDETQTMTSTPVSLTKFAEETNCTLEEVEQLQRAVEKTCERLEEAHQFLVDRELEDCWLIWREAILEPNMYANDWNRWQVREIVQRLTVKKTLSERQVHYLGDLLKKIANNDRLNAEREVERQAAEPLPIPEGQENIRLTVSGEVLSVKDKGWGWKMLVRSDDGWKVWGSLPRAISDCKPGDFVRFDATIKASETDNKFGFFARPTKAVILHSA